jgi:hypothetical protein
MISTRTAPACLCSNAVRDALSFDPNTLSADIHEPLILPEDASDLWLDPGFQKTDVVCDLLKPFDPALTRRYEVSSRVNLVKNNDAACAEHVVREAAAAGVHYSALLSFSGSETQDEGKPHYCYFFRSRFALAVARRSHGAISEVIDACPKLDISVSPVDIAAAFFSLTIRLYSAGEHLFPEIRSMRREMVSQDASVSLVIIEGSDIAFLLRVFRIFMVALLDAEPEVRAHSQIPQRGVAPVHLQPDCRDVRV